MIISSDELAFRAVYQEVFPLILKVAHHVTYNLDSAEDICQEAFEKFFESAKEFPTMEDAKYWLIRVTRNLAINYIKRKGREKDYIDKAKRDFFTVPSKANGEDEAIKEETVQGVKDAVAKLPANYRDVIVLKEYCGLDYAQMAKILGLSETNVKVRMHRARKFLENLLADG
ncbi:MAG: RNA polymerase sigma factor [Sphaerochaetaceae bacterium]|jgi:RNA polymerase sigma-70 factor (ECF subfamily)|nr:RNA polymerase sigma factor [Sphaerochaetaceae bacterium]